MIKSKIKKIQKKIRNNLTKCGKIFLLFFLVLIIITILIRLITSAMIDMGYYNGKFHLWYWKDPDIINKWKNFSTTGSATLNGLPNNISAYKSLGPEKWLPNHTWNVYMELWIRSSTHPDFFWTFTQFTWQTMIIISLIITFRLFFYKDTGGSLGWIKKPTTLSLVTMYSIIVGIGFWTTLFISFKNTFPIDKHLFMLEMITTILAHFIIPLIMSIYSLVDLFTSRKANIIKWKSFFIGMIYPISYVLFYLLIATIWQDPYIVTNIQHNNDFLFVPVIVLILSFFMLMMICLHNIFLTNFNKHFKKRIFNKIKIIKKNN